MSRGLLMTFNVVYTARWEPPAVVDARQAVDDGVEAESLASGVSHSNSSVVLSVSTSTHFLL